MPGTPMLLYKLDELGNRFPWVLPVIGFVGGWLSYIMVQRGDSLARLVALIVLAGWFWLLIQPWILRWCQPYLPKPTLNLLSNFVSQSLQQEILFFCLPFLLWSTHENAPGQIIFTALVFLAALLSTLDPIYEKYIASDRATSLTFHSMCTFVAALIVLPIVVKIPLEKTFYLALGFVTLWLLLSVPRLYSRYTTLRGKITVLAVIIAIPLGLLVFRQSIPPAGIVVTRSLMTDSVVEHEPASQLTRISPERLSQGVYAYVAIRAPQGLAQAVLFNWKHEGFSEVITSTITGGREEGYRTYALKENFPADMEGKWDVDIRTPQGQLLERLSFRVDGSEIIGGDVVEIVTVEAEAIESQSDEAAAVETTGNGMDEKVEVAGEFAVREEAYEAGKVEHAPVAVQETIY